MDLNVIDFKANMFLMNVTNGEEYALRPEDVALVREPVDLETRQDRADDLEGRCVHLSWCTLVFLGARAEVTLTQRWVHALARRKADQLWLHGEAANKLVQSPYLATCVPEQSLDFRLLEAVHMHVND